MPDYGFNYQLGPTTKLMTLADMLNLAGGAQSLMQAQQMNPLLLQEAQQKLRQQQLLTQKAEALTPQEIKTGGIKLEEEAKQAPIGTQKAQFERDTAIGKLATQIIGGVGTDPRIQNAAQDPKGAIDALTQTAQVMVASGIDPKAAQMFLAPVIAVAQHEPGKLPQVMKNIAGMGTTSEAQTDRMTPQLTVTPSGAPMLYTAGTSTVTQPKIEQQGMPQQAPQGGQQSRPQVVETEMNMPPMRFKKREAGDISPYGAGEKEEETYGIKYKQNLMSGLDGLTSSKRRLEEVIETASGLKNSGWPTAGIFGSAVRTIRNWAGDPTYKELSKELANSQLAVMQASGGALDSQEGIKLAKFANGDETYPPEVLIKIARRTFADLQDAEMRAIAVDKFTQRYGDANPSTFKQLWRQNSDSKLFEAISIQKSNLSNEEKRAEINKLYANISPQQAEKLRKMRENLEELMKTGTIKYKM